MKAKLEKCAYYFKNFKGQTSNSIKGVNLNKNYYKILQVDNSACQLTIKKAYFRLAKKLHPDVNPSGHNEFTEIQQAYNILCDKESKMYYDQNNSFYPRHRPQNSQKYSKEAEDLNYRNSYFYESMKNKAYQDYRQYEKDKQREERQKEYRQEKKQDESQEAKERKRTQEQIKIARMILFSRNPMWQRANSYMNYEERMRANEEKQRQFESLFPEGSKIGKFLKKFI